MINEKIQDKKEEGISKREEIERICYQKSNKNFIRYGVSMAIAGLLGFSAMCYFGLRDNPYERTSAVSQYRAMQKTLDKLKYEKNLVGDIDMPYKPEHLKQDLENLIEDKLKRADILDKVINSVETDIQRIEGEKEFKDYKNIQNKRSNYSIFILTGTAAAMFGLGFYAIKRNLKIHEEGSKALRELQ
ncbi:MAG: hypothetical protein AABY22_02940 [Nanoarchaeota archaeon]